MSAVSGIWNSEKGIVAVLLITGATVLACLGKITFTEWRDYTTWIFGIYAGTKMVQGTAAVVTSQRAANHKAKDTEKPA